MNPFNKNEFFRKSMKIKDLIVEKVQNLESPIRQAIISSCKVLLNLNRQIITQKFRLGREFNRLDGLKKDKELSQEEKAYMEQLENEFYTYSSENEIIKKYSANLLRSPGEPYILGFGCNTVAFYVGEVDKISVALKIYWKSGFLRQYYSDNNYSKTKKNFPRLSLNDELSAVEEYCKLAELQSLELMDCRKERGPLFICCVLIKLPRTEYVGILMEDFTQGGKFSIKDQFGSCYGLLATRDTSIQCDENDDRHQQEVHYDFDSHGHHCHGHCHLKICDERFCENFRHILDVYGDKQRYTSKRNLIVI